MRGHAWSAAGIYRPFKKNSPLPPKTPPTLHLHSPLSQAPLGAGGQFWSQCKYILSLSKTHFPTTVKGEEGTLEGRGLREEGERVGVKFFPSSSPSLVCCCLPVSSNIWHCLSPGLLVQSRRERLKGEHSGYPRSAIAGLKDNSRLLQFGLLFL